MLCFPFRFRVLLNSPLSQHGRDGGRWAPKNKESWGEFSARGAEAKPSLAETENGDDRSRGEQLRSDSDDDEVLRRALRRLLFFFSLFPFLFIPPLRRRPFFYNGFMKRGYIRGTREKRKRAERCLRGWSINIGSRGWNWGSRVRRRRVTEKEREREREKERTVVVLRLPPPFLRHRTYGRNNHLV